MKLLIATVAMLVATGSGAFAYAPQPEEISPGGSGEIIDRPDVRIDPDGPTKPAAVVTFPLTG